MDVKYENRSITLYAGPNKKIEYSTHTMSQMELAGQDGLDKSSKQLPVWSQQ